MTETEWEMERARPSLPCSATSNGRACAARARYPLILEEAGPEGAASLDEWLVCPAHLSFAAESGFAVPTPHVGDAEDVYLTLHERTVSVASLDGGPAKQ